MHGAVRFAFALLLTFLLAGPASWAAWATEKAGGHGILDVQADLVRLGIASRDVVGDGQTDVSAEIQAAIDFLAGQPGGGTLVFGPGVYRASGLVVQPGVRIAGADRQSTVFRPVDRGILFDMRGGELHNFTVYGTPTAEVSGDHWQVGTGGIGRGGTAWSLHLIRVGQMPEHRAENVLISGVTALEARYDALYVRGSKGLRVIDCEFDRSGRNNVSLVGDDEGFLFANCRFGSLWGLYHFDFEPNEDRFVRDGLIVNCEFDGRQAGAMNTDRWGAMLIFSGHEKIANRNIAVVGSRFHEIAVRVRGVFEGAQFLYNPVLGGRNRVFVKVRTNPVGEFRDAVVRGNRFIKEDGRELEHIISGATFTGKSRFEGNEPAAFDQTEILPAGKDTHWEEDHPVAQPANRQPLSQRDAAAEAGQEVEVTVPLMGHRIRFSDGAILGREEAGQADLIFHIDPLMAEGAAGIQRLVSPTAAETVVAEAFGSTLWGVVTGDVLAVRTQGGQLVLLEILEQQRQAFRIRYRLLTTAAAG